MNDFTAEDMKRAASAEYEKLFSRLDEKLSARPAMDAEMERRKKDGEVLILTDDEMAMIRSYRRFLLRVKRGGEVFRWQVAKPEGIVVAADTALVVAPNEAEEVERG
jgi:hypothetical protein